MRVRWKRRKSLDGEIKRSKAQSLKKLKSRKDEETAQSNIYTIFFPSNSISGGVENESIFEISYEKENSKKIKAQETEKSEGAVIDFSISEIFLCLCFKRERKAVGLILFI